MRIGQYEFKAHIVKYPDGHLIDLTKIIPLFIGVTQGGPNIFLASIITSNAIKKLNAGISKSLEVISFEFNTMEEAIHASNYMTVVLIGKETIDESNESDESE